MTYAAPDDNYVPLKSYEALDWRSTPDTIASCTLGTDIERSDKNGSHRRRLRRPLYRANARIGGDGLRRSSGMACCRHGSNGSLEVLLVQKRYTYGFVSFVLGQYNRHDDERLRGIFASMTIQEKIDVSSLRFDIMWHRIWMEFPETSTTRSTAADITAAWDVTAAVEGRTLRKYSRIYRITTSRLETYIQKTIKFESVFVADGGRRLRALMVGAANGELRWEIPKGRRERGETILDCSIREFKEETGVNTDSYAILFDVKPVVEQYVSDGVTYIHGYHVAYALRDFTPIVDFGMQCQASEIAAIRWVGVDELRFVDKDGKLSNLMTRIFSVFKSRVSQKPCVTHL